MKTNQEIFKINVVSEEAVQEVADMIDGVNKEVIADSIQLSNSTTTIHYDVHRTIGELVVLTGDTVYDEVNISAQFPLFFESTNSRYIPNKVKFAIERYCSQPLLKKIHPNKEVAVELCLIYISNLSNAFYENKAGWKRLNASLLREQVSTSSKERNVYQLIFDLLSKGTSKGPIIERSSNYTPGQESYRYRLTEVYRNKGVIKYEFKTTYAKNLVRKLYFKQLNAAVANPIASNLIKVYSMIDLPSIEEIKAEAKKLIKSKYITKKGKRLTKRNKHKNDYWDDANNRSFVEDNIELFLRLTENGYLIPTISEEKAGGRVTDSFTLMPSWIRNICKIDGKRIVEADYSALHPNIAIKLYNGQLEYITHSKVAEDLGMELIDVKIEHLSFFNHKWSNMYKSPLFKYYEKNDYGILGNLHVDKAVDYKITSRKMFRLEVDIMTAVIIKLNSEGIYVGYVYDALFCAPKDKDRVTTVMNEEIIKFGVKTTAK